MRPLRPPAVPCSGRCVSRLLYLAAVQSEHGLRAGAGSEEAVMTSLTDVDFVPMRFGKVVAVGSGGVLRSASCWRA